MAEMVYRIRAVDEASSTFKGIADSINNMNRIAGNASGQPLASPSDTSSDSSSSGQNINDIRANGNGSLITSQNMTEKLSLISENLNKITTMLPQLLEKMGKGGSSSGGNSEASGNIANLQKNVRNGLMALTLGASLYSGEKRYAAGMTRASLKGMEGDVFGEQMAEINADTSRKTSWTSAIPVVAGLLGGAFGGPGGALLGGMGGDAAKKIIDNLIGSDADNQLAELEKKSKTAQTYENFNSVMDRMYFSFGKALPGNSNMDANKTSLANSLVYSKGSGMDLKSFMELTSQAADYGINYETVAGKMARNAALIARNTNGDANQIMSYLGTQSRFGNANGVDSINYAYSAAKASGLNNNQFGEFLTGLQDVIETGIANGYVASSEEVSKTMLMFSKLSNDNPVWQGKYGFDRMKTINSGIAGATSLSNSSQMMVYQAYAELAKNGMKGGAFIEGADGLNAMSLMEGGLQNASQFNALKKYLMNQYAGDPESMVMAIKEMTGLNITGSMQMYKMMQNGTEISDVDVEQINKEFATDSSKQLDYLNNIQLDTAYIGSDAYIEKLSLLRDKAGIDENEEKSEDSKAAKALIDSYAGLDKYDAAGNKGIYEFNHDLNARIKTSDIDSLGFYVPGVSDYQKMYDKYSEGGFSLEEIKELSNLLKKINENIVKQKVEVHNE